MTDLVAPPALKKDTRMLAVTLAGLAGLMLIAASFTKAWLVNPHYGVGFGLFSMSTCNGGECASISNLDFMAKAREFAPDEVSSVFAPIGIITMILCLVGALGLLVTAYFGFVKKRIAWPIMPQTVALLGVMGALLTGCVFIATKPGGVGAVGVGWSFWAFGIGSVAGIIGAQMLNKLIKPVDPDLAALGVEGV
jgi:hypothetical protein